MCHIAFEANVTVKRSPGPDAFEPCDFGFVDHVVALCEEDLGWCVLFGVLCSGATVVSFPCN